MPWRETLNEHYPGALEWPDLLARCNRHLGELGIRPANTLFGNVMCRDEINKPDFEAFAASWGENFNLAGLGGYPAAGVTGFTAFHHHGNLARIPSLVSYKHLTHRWHPGHGCRCLIHIGCADGARDVMAVDNYMALTQVKNRATSHLRNRTFIFERSPLIARFPGHCPVHRARIDVRAFQHPCHGACYRALSCSRRSIDGNHHVYRLLALRRRPGTGVARGSVRLRRNRSTSIPESSRTSPRPSRLSRIGPN